MYDRLAQDLGTRMGALIAGGTLEIWECNFTILFVPESEVQNLILQWYDAGSRYPVSKFLNAQVCIHSTPNRLGTIGQIVGEF